MDDGSVVEMGLRLAQCTARGDACPTAKTLKSEVQAPTSKILC